MAHIAVSCPWSELSEAVQQQIINGTNMIIFYDGSVAVRHNGRWHLVLGACGQAGEAGAFVQGANK